jgi:uncharacterized protein involved in exopolysaccharide biosynthesis
MSQATGSHGMSAEQVVGFAQLLSFLSPHWRLLTVSVVLGAILGGIGGLVAPKRYEASVVLSVAPNPSGGGQVGSLGSLAAQFGGLASLAGLSVGSGSRDAENVAFLGSDQLLRSFVAQNKLDGVLASRTLMGSFRRVIGTEDEPPSRWRATQVLKNRVRTVTQDSKTRLITVRVVWKDPGLAAEWANGLVALANQTLRDKAIAEFNRNIAYLEGRLPKIDQVEIRQGVFGMIQSELGRVMLAEGSQEYAFRVVDPAVVAEKPVSPVIALWVFVGGVLGGAVPFAWMLLSAMRARLAGDSTSSQNGS